MYAQPLTRILMVPLTLLFFVTSGLADINLGSYSDSQNGKYRPEDFSKLSLNVKELYGSRWALDRNESIIVHHQVIIADAGLIHGHELTLRLEFTLSQHWIAPDLNFPQGLFRDSDSDNETFLNANVNVLKNMWSPDSYISSARESKVRTQGAELMLVYIGKNRFVYFTSRMTAKVGCTSSFQWYPVDVQSCALVITSFKAQNNLTYQWMSMYPPKPPVILEMRRLMQYELQLPVEYDNGVDEPAPNARFPFVRVKFTLARKLGNNIIQVYTPTSLVVVLSWFSFWLGLDAIPGRISLLVTCMLTLVTMHGGIKTSIPPVHYITMMDVWLVCCMAMVFAAICEFVVVKYVHWRSKMEKKSEVKEDEFAKQTKLLQLMLGWVGGVTPKWKNAWYRENELLYRLNNMDSEMNDGTMQNCSGKGPVHAKKTTNKIPVWVKVDKISRALFPLLFAFFNGIYWPVLLTRGTTVKDYDDAYYENDV